MKKIAPEIDSLMWTLAESGNQQAIVEFETRFPTMRLELSKRISMVRSLRMNKPESVAAPAIPRFNPGQPTAPRAPKATYMFTAAFIVIALSALGFTLMSNLQHKAPTLVPVPQVNIDVAPLPQPTFSRQLPPATYSHSGANPVPNALTQPSVVQNVPAPMPKWEKEQTVTMRGAPLQTIAKIVAAEGGLSLEIAPGMPNPTIDVDYQQVSAANILKDLGRQYAFTPMLSDDGSVILIPAVSHGADASLPPATGG